MTPSLPTSGRQRASLVAAIVCGGLWVWLAVAEQTLSWSLPAAAAWFAWRGLRDPNER